LSRSSRPTESRIRPLSPLGPLDPIPAEPLELLDPIPAEPLELLVRNPGLRPNVWARRIGHDPVACLHDTHSRTAGMASRRSVGISFPQRSHLPYVPASNRRSAATTSP
jgi:hypothetical protein